MTPILSRIFSKVNAPAVLVVALAAYVYFSGTRSNCPRCLASTTPFFVNSPVNRSSIISRSKVERPVMVWSAQEVEGKAISNATLVGKIVIIDFWATWCPPCRQEIPGLVELHKRYGAQGLVVVGFSLDETAETVRRFARKSGILYPLVMADENLVWQFGGVTSLPTTFILDRQGRLVSHHLGYVEPQVLEEEIKPLL